MLDQSFKATAQGYSFTFQNALEGGAMDADTDDSLMDLEEVRENGQNEELSDETSSVLSYTSQSHPSTPMAVLLLSSSLEANEELSDDTSSVLSYTSQSHPSTSMAVLPKLSSSSLEANVIPASSPIGEKEKPTKKIITSAIRSVIKCPDGEMRKPNGSKMLSCHRVH
jgi:hypothetical protein